MIDRIIRSLSGSARPFISVSAWVSMYHCELEETRKDRRRGCRGRVFTSRGGGCRLGRRSSASQPCHTRTDGRATYRRRRRRRRRDACLRSDSVHHLGKRRDARAGVGPTCDQAGSIDSSVEGVNAALRNRALLQDRERILEIGRTAAS